MKALFLVLISGFIVSSVEAGWIPDFSRRQKDLVQFEKQKKVYKEENKTMLDMVTDRQTPMQDLVIIHTKEGFKPARPQVKRNQRYRVHVINVDKEHKNVSFMADSFSQHHGTYFAEEVVFEIEPRKEGLFDFQCPETSAKGQFLVFASDEPIESPLENIRLRQPASE